MTRQAQPESTGALSPALCTPAFSGRERELAELARAVAQPPAVVLVEGEAGIGKTRLLREFLSTPSGRDLAVLVATCPPFREPCTLAPLVDAVRQVTASVAGLALSPLGGALRSLFPEWAADLPDAPEPAEDATAARHRVFRALAELLGCLGITALVLEDAHWADDATLEFLIFLATQRVPHSSLVVTYRPDDVPPGSLLLRLSSRLPIGTTMVRMALEPLGLSETEAFVASMLPGAQVSPGFATFLREHTEGLPLAMEETLRLMHDRADLVHRDGGWVRRRLGGIAVPPTVRDAVLERASRLGPEAQAVLHAAAVAGEPVGEPMLLAVADLPEADGRSGLSEALRCGLLQENSHYRIAFRHSLACKAVHEAIPPPQRRLLHFRAGEALRNDTPLPVIRLARHYRNAGDIENWCRYAEQSAEQASAAGDDATAAAVLFDLITTASLPARSVVRLARSLPMGSLNGKGRMLSLVSTLRSLLETGKPAPADEAELRFQLARALMVMHDYKAAQPELMQVVRELPRHSVERARAMIFLGVPLGVVQPASVHLNWLREAEKVLPAISPGDRLHLDVDRTAALLLLGEHSGWREAARIPHDAPTARERGELILGHGNVGEFAMRWGRYAEARRRLSLSLGLAEKYEYLALRDWNAVMLAHLDWLTGRWDGQAERMAPFTKDDQVRPSMRSEAALVLGLRHAALGDCAEAERRLLASHAGGREGGAIDQVAEPAAALARLWMAGGRADEALTITAEPTEIAVGKGIWVCGAEVVPIRVELLAATGRASEAAELAAAFAALVDGRDAPAARAAVASCEATLATDPDRAVALFGRAAAAWQALPRPYDALLARERQGESLLAAGRTSAGCDLLADVAAGLATLGARAAAIRVIARLRRHGVNVRRPWLGGSRGYGDELSPRELDVVRLVVDGRSNPQIAKTLVLSPKTVARHVDGAMRKLSVSSRTALAVKAVAEGICAPAAAGSEPRLGQSPNR